ncbi:MAG: class I SAM-dependent methyltransferase [Gaiellales bacterium]
MSGSLPPSRYDDHATWYTEFRPSLPPDERDVIERHLGRGDGSCLDLGCGAGAAIPALSQLGWHVCGIDRSAAMLAVAASAGAELHHASAESMPFADATFDACVSFWTHTDVDDFAAVIDEAFRVLKPGSPLVYIGAHPCFVGPHWELAGPEGVPLLHPGYGDTERYFTGPAVTPDGLRRRVGANHLPLAQFISAFLHAGFEIGGLEEHGWRQQFPHKLAIACRKPPT